MAGQPLVGAGSDQEQIDPSSIPLNEDYWLHDDTEMPQKTYPSPPTPPPAPPVVVANNQSAVDRASGLPQILHFVVSYVGNLQPDMGVCPDELDQRNEPDQR